MTRLIAVAWKRVVQSLAGLELFLRITDNFLRRYITVDWTRIYQRYEYNKRLSSGFLEWTGSRRRRRLWNLQLIFWSSRGNIHFDNLEKERLINGECNQSLLVRVSQEIKNKRFKNKVLFYIQCSFDAENYRILNGFRIIQIRPRCKFFCSVTWKKLAGWGKYSNSDVKDLPKTYIFDNLKKLEKTWSIWI